MPVRKISLVSLLVDDYDKAIQFYTEVLDFILVEDTRLGDTKRWVRLSPGKGDGCQVLLARATDAEQQSRIGNQTGGRVFLFLHTDNFQEDYCNLVNKGVRIVREPRTEEYGTVAVFADLYGNLWDLISPKPMA